MTDIKIIERKEEMTMTKDLCAALKSKADDYKLYGGYSEIDSGTEQENDRLRPIIDALIAVIEMQDAGLTKIEHDNWSYGERHDENGIRFRECAFETRAAAHEMLERILK
jgi:hypothetical protein